AVPDRRRLLRPPRSRPADGDGGAVAGDPTGLAVELRARGGGRSLRSLAAPAGRHGGGEGVMPRRRTSSPGRLNPAEPSEARPAVILVATPIGNLGDLSPRAVQALTDADVIAAEDTRRTRPLLTAAGIPSAGRLVSFHGPDEPALAAKLVERIIERNERLVCVTDAGMPGISDPGERLVTAALAAGVAVEVVPGPSAALAALVLSGLPTGRFVFEGFLPRKGRQRAVR